MVAEKIVEDYHILQRMAAGTARLDRITKIRDLSVITLIGDICLVLACDSNASNGEKVNDFHKESYEESAISVLKVPTMEVLAAGATPIVIINNLCVEMEPTGRRIIEIMKKELEDCGLWQNLQFTGSTEDNMKTTQSGMGVTVIGIAEEKNLRLGRTKAGDFVFCVGFPQSGVTKSYSERDENVAKIATVQALAALPYVHEILPVGSKGSAYEASELAACARCRFVMDKGCEIDMQTSAGSSTAVLVSLEGKDAERLKHDMGIVSSWIGTMEPL